MNIPGDEHSVMNIPVMNIPGNEHFL